MSKILKRPMFRKGGSADSSTNGGVMKIANPRSNFEVGGTAKRYEENLKLLQQAAGPAGDSKQDLYDMLISGGLNLAGGVGAGDGTLASIARSFKQPAEQFLAKRPGEEQFQRQVRMAAAQGAITQQQAQEILQKELAGKKEIAQIQAAAREGTTEDKIEALALKNMDYYQNDFNKAKNKATYDLIIRNKIASKFGQTQVGGVITTDLSDIKKAKELARTNRTKVGKVFFDLNTGEAKRLAQDAEGNFGFVVVDLESEGVETPQAPAVTTTKKTGTEAPVFSGSLREKSPLKQMDIFPLKKTEPGFDIGGS
jgi:hypothetical protein